MDHTSDNQNSLLFPLAGNHKEVPAVGATKKAFWSSLSGALDKLDKSVVHFTEKETQEFGLGFYHRGQKYVHHTRLHPRHTALRRTSSAQIKVILAFFFLLLLAFIINWHLTIVIFLAVLTLLYFTDLLFNFYLIYRSFTSAPEVVVNPIEFESFPEDKWPIYTVMCPLYKEWEVLPQFAEAMGHMDYPKDKLQVMLLFEEDDVQTVEKARNLGLPDYFEIVVVPHSLPKTKPKACNYGLMLAKGEYSVIYDAEDVPDRDQLKKAIVAFRKVPKNVACIQAKLNFYNPHHNILTRAFTAEYSLWFDLVLTGLQSINAPIPLGGTSNHFKTERLKELHGWDAFNVTEDCDLGIRLVKRGFKTAIMDSTTLEEANSDVHNWFRQRSRWIKGYMQTYLVHMRNPMEFITHWREPHVVTFQIIVGGKVLSMFINPIMWVITILYFTMRPIVGDFIESLFPTPVLYMAVFSLIFGNFLYVYYYMIGCAKREHYDLIKYVFLVPIYWLAMSVAAWIALYELVAKPHYWQKTKHGLHLNNQKAMKQVEEKVGRNMVQEGFIQSQVVQ